MPTVWQGHLLLPSTCVADKCVIFHHRLHLDEAGLQFCNPVCNGFPFY